MKKDCKAYFYRLKEAEKFKNKINEKLFKSNAKIEKDTQSGMYIVIYDYKRLLKED